MMTVVLTLALGDTNAPTIGYQVRELWKNLKTCRLFGETLHYLCFEHFTQIMLTEYFTKHCLQAFGIIEALSQTVIMALTYYCELVQFLLTLIFVFYGRKTNKPVNTNGLLHIPLHSKRTCKVEHFHQCLLGNTVVDARRYTAWQ